MTVFRKHAGFSLVTALSLSVLLVGGFAGMERYSRTEVPDLHVAVAANFLPAAGALAARFEEKTGRRVLLSVGSTGQLYAQIRNGAPFDLFLAADAERPGKLEREGAALPGSRFTYAVGRLVLWSHRPGLVDDAGRVLKRGAFRHLALANPELAPYGEAARQTLRNMGVWEEVKDRVVLGGNVSQTHQFVHTGNAELGFIARSQLEACRGEGSFWLVPPSLHAPIRQQAVLLRENPVAPEFVSFLRSAEGAGVVREFGFGIP